MTLPCRTQYYQVVLMDRINLNQQQIEDLSLMEFLKTNLHTSFMGRRVFYLRSTTSTMDDARELALAGATQGTLVMAEEQTAGRGRLQRRWLSPPGASLLLSLIFRPTLQELPRLPMIGGLAIVRAIYNATGLEASLKWPNDVLLGGKKVCGLLAEADVSAQDRQVAWAVLGLGLNIDLDPKAFPEIAATATSLVRETGRPVSRWEVLCYLLEAMEDLYLSLQQGRAVFKEWRDRLETLGKVVAVTFASGETAEGLAEAVTEEGALVLKCKDGRQLEVMAGDVTLRA